MPDGSIKQISKMMETSKNRLKYLIIILMALAFSFCSRQADHVISLAGSWQFSLDPDDIGLSSEWSKMDFDKTIDLPGTTDEADYGEKTTDTAYGVLSREYKYIGVAWYSKKVSIPASWEEQGVMLLLERVLWESQVFVDGQYVGMQDGLGTPHWHNLGVLSPGEHKITLRINNDMVHNIGDKGHAYGAYMQSIWNGVVGKIELQARNSIHITQVRTFPKTNTNSLKVEITSQNPAGDELNYLITLREKESQKIVDLTEYLTDKEKFELELKPENEIHDWTEFNPFLYELVVQINPPLSTDKSVTTFGFANVSHNQHHVLINNEPVFLRGNLDCIHFPLTGYPAMDVDSWKTIFGKYKEYGLNHVRFHSWCPPDAAFTAADELGIYIQAEASVWIDWWMGVDMIARGRPEMETKGHPQGIGRGDTDSDEFIRAEMQRMVDTYGNHPSFVMFCIGNELGSSNFTLMGEWIKSLKEYDPRRLYAASTARTITPYCDYSATHNIPGIGGVRQRLYNHTDWNYEDHYSKARVPIIAHEVGQWPVYPDWSEIKKYTGVLKARNLEQLAHLAMERGIYDQDKEFRSSSGKLSALLYKDEIESFMRTRSCAGYQLLSMQDYIGQGEALIGWLDSFYDPKGALDPATARQYMNAVVPLISLPSYTFIGGDTLNIKAQLHQFGPTDLKDQVISWTLLNENKQTIQDGRFDPADYPKGVLNDIGNISILLPDGDSARSL
ncbi:MAG: glycoside hydrolase family 2, partial [Bacteroidales bacterium]|nr:glycoside hydrolase family 2 [Bacteroidales bacterium]